MKTIECTANVDDLKFCLCLKYIVARIMRLYDMVTCCQNTQRRVNAPMNLPKWLFSATISNWHRVIRSEYIECREKKTFSKWNLLRMLKRQAHFSSHICLFDLAKQRLIHHDDAATCTTDRMPNKQWANKIRERKNILKFFFLEKNISHKSYASTRLSVFVCDYARTRDFYFFIHFFSRKLTNASVLITLMSYYAT